MTGQTVCFPQGADTCQRKRPNQVAEKQEGLCGKGEFKMMLQLLQDGTALYFLVTVCMIGLVSKWIAKNSYKRLIKETNNMGMSKNKHLRNLKQKAEDAYRVNQGIVNTKVYLEKQLFEMKVGMFTPQGWAGFSNQMTWLCLLAGGALSFLSYWYRCDSYYIVLYGTVGVMAAVLNIIAENGVCLDAKRQQLFVSLQNYLENVLWHRMEIEKAGECSEDDARMVESEQPVPVRNNVRELRDRKKARRVMEQQTAASRDRGQKKNGISRDMADKLALAGADGDNWMKELKPEEIRVLGEIIREYLG